MRSISIGPIGTRAASASRMGLWSLTLLLATIPTVASASDDQSDSRKNRLLVGVIVGQREVSTLEIIEQDGDFLVPLQPFTTICGCRFQVLGGVSRLSTPLGTVELEPRDLPEAEGVTYLREEAIEDKLATPVTFDSQEFALVFDFPWRPQADEARPASAPVLEPEVTPPGVSISSLQPSLRYQQSRETARGSGSMMLGGRLGGGWWQTRLENDTEGNRSLRDYAWLRTAGSKLLLLGHQRVHLHPLLGSLQMTGLQAAWTNQPMEIFAGNPDPRELLPRRLRSVTTIRGHGPPAGWAELRINDRLVARQAMGLDGLYEFLDIFLPSRQLSRVEVLLYDRQDLSIPMEVHDHSRSGSEFLLPARALVSVGGIGQDGNLARELLGSDPRSRAVGFYQSRYGLSSDLTLEAAVQQTPDQRQLFAGVVTRLGKGLVTSLGVASSAGRFGYEAAVEGSGAAWRLRARSRATSAGFDFGGSSGIADHFFELGYRGGRRVEISLIGRSRTDAYRQRQFLLPAVVWRPNTAISLRARPDYDGRYYLDLSYRIRAAGRLALRRAPERTLIHLSYRLKQRLRLALSSEPGARGANRQAAIINGLGGG